MTKSLKLLKNSFVFYCRNWKTLLGIILVAVPVMAYQAFTGNETSIVNLIGSVISIFMAIALTIAIINLDNGEKPGVREAYNISKDWFFSYIWIAILEVLVLIVGLILLVIPAAVFGIWIAFSRLELLVENKRGTKALKSSRELVRGRWWQVFRRYLAIGLIDLIILGAVALLMAQLFGLEAILSPDQPDPLPSFIIQIVAVVTVTPINTIYSYLMYKDLKKPVAKNGKSKSKPAKRAGK